MTLGQWRLWDVPVLPNLHPEIQLYYRKTQCTSSHAHHPFFLHLPPLLLLQRAIPSTGFHFASAHSSPQPQGPPSYHFIHRSLDLAFLSGSPVPAQHGCPRCSQRPQSAFSSLNCLFPSGYIPSFLYSPRIPQLSPYSYFLPLLWMCSILWSGNVPIILSQPPSSGLVPLLETPLSGISCFSIRVSWN